MLDAAAFLVRQPEFRTCPEELLEAALADAEARIDASVFGSSENEAHKWLTADILAHSPWGRASKLVGDEGKTTNIYGQKYQELVNIVAAGYGVT